jgi:hypothetical protein
MIMNWPTFSPAILTPDEDGIHVTSDVPHAQISPAVVVAAPVALSELAF